MKIGITAGNMGPYVEPERAVELATRAEQIGVESLWAAEIIAVPAEYESRYAYTSDGRVGGGGEVPIADPLVWLTYIAATTTNLKLGTGILLLPAHNPVLVAKQCTTLDRLSHGRLMLGVGVGWLKEMFDAMGVPFSERGQRAEDYVRAMRALWSSDEGTHHGPFVNFDKLRINPRPIQPAGPPVIIAGHGEAAARRAGRVGDGFYIGEWPARTMELIAIMRDAAVKAGRDPDAIEVTACPAGILKDGRPDRDVFEKYAQAGVSRVIVGLATEAAKRHDPGAFENDMSLVGEIVALVSHP
jgi:probable F420-dependent oxidoreductase